MNTNNATNDINEDSIILIEAFIEARADYNISSAKLDNIKADMEVVGREVKHLEEAVEKHPQSRTLFNALGVYAEREDILKEKYERVWEELESQGLIYANAVHGAEEAGLLKRTGEEWWQVELA